MKKNTPNKQPNKNSLVNNHKVWKKPVLIELDIKQTLVRDCGSGIWSDEVGDCVPN